MSNRKLAAAIEFSSQSVRGIVIDPKTGEIVSQPNAIKLDFFGLMTTDGVIVDGKKVVIPPLLLVIAVEAVMQQFADEGLAGEIVCIGSNAQQHGTFYAGSDFQVAISSMDPKKPIAANLANCFIRDGWPTWQDASSAEAAGEIEGIYGGKTGCIAATGSPAHLRFGLPQIRQFAEADAGSYMATSFIGLFSSLIPTLLAGEIADIDYGDGLGMALADAKAKAWHQKGLSAIDGLSGRLPKLVSSTTIVGKISGYWVNRFGFSPECKIAVGSGDNPDTASGFMLREPGAFAASIGTSATVFAQAGEYATDPAGLGSVFGSTTNPKHWLPLICLRNSVLSLEALAIELGLWEKNGEQDWAAFDALAAKISAGNGKRFLLALEADEITPNIEAGMHSNATGLGKAEKCRSALEGLLMLMRYSSGWMGDSPKKLALAGGASKSALVCQTLASIFNCPVEVLETPDVALLGSAMRAAVALENAEPTAEDWERICGKCRKVEQTYEPDPTDAETYAAILPEFGEWVETLPRAS